jgi:general secretion pathway protein A
MRLRDTDVTSVAMNRNQSAHKSCPAEWHLFMVRNHISFVQGLLMYEAFYGLREKPFSILPDPDLIYWCQNHRLAFAMLEFGVMNSAGFTVITGEIGCGKTTLVRYLLRRLDEHVTVCLISNTPRTQDGLLRWVMMSLNQPFEGSYLALFKQFQRFLYDQYSKGRRTILIVDEAQNLGLEALEELRMLSNVNTDKQQFLQIILIGQPQLKDMLRAPQLIQFAQRVSSDFHLRPLNIHEVSDYIDFRLRAVGSRSQLFTDDACKIIADTSRGIPRTINILCDTALVYGFAAGAERITAELVNTVIENKAQFGVLPFGLLPV